MYSLGNFSGPVATILFLNCSHTMRDTSNSSMNLLLTFKLLWLSCLCPCFSHWFNLGGAQLENKLNVTYFFAPISAT